MRTLNVFKLSAGRIEYTQAILDAVLNPRITGLKLHLNGGWDYIDCKYMFIKLLLKRGQVAEISTHSDLMARQDYIEAIAEGRGLKSINFDCINAPVFGEITPKMKRGYASEKRMRAAHERFHRELKLLGEAREARAEKQLQSLEFKSQVDSITFEDIQAHRAMKAVQS